jgi:hypothetical protein
MTWFPPLARRDQLADLNINDALTVDGEMLQLIHQAQPEWNEHIVLGFCKTYLKKVREANEAVEKYRSKSE